MNIIPLFLGEDSPYILPCLMFSILYGTLLFLKTPKLDKDTSMFFKGNNWIFTLLFLINILMSILSSAIQYIYVGIFFLIILFTFEIRKNRISQNEVFFDREDILDSGELGNN